MNVFRMAGDTLHVLQVVFVLQRLISHKSGKGISRKSLELLLLVWFLRYLDMFTRFYSLEVTCLQLFYIGSTTVSLIVLSHHPVKDTYQQNLDHPQRHWMRLVFPTVLAIATFTYFDDPNVEITYHFFLNFCWATSIFLEPLALIPQVYVYFRSSDADGQVVAGSILLMMGAYRGIYIVNWIFRAHTEEHYRHHTWIYAAGICHALIGIGGLVFCGRRTVGGRSKQKVERMGPFLVQWFKSSRVAQVVVVLFLILTFHKNSTLLDDVNRIRSQDSKNRVWALLLTGSAILFCGVVYCGFTTSPVKDVESDEEGGKVIRKGIFVHGVQIV